MLDTAVDESAEQTGRIHQMQRERRTLAGLIAREERKDLLKNFATRNGSCRRWTCSIPTRRA